MKDRDLTSPDFEHKCLTIDDFYRYIALPPGESFPDLTSHLAHCPKCQEELAEVLRLLNSESEDRTDDDCNLSDQEITQTLNLIQGVARKEETSKRRSRRLHWAAAAAAAIVLLGAGAGALKYYQNRVSNQYFEQARASLEEVYAPVSPSGLRLNLPFHSAAAKRAANSDSSLKDAENLFYQAVVGRSTMPEAHLGLGAIYLRESRFERAREEFQKVLDVQRSSLQAFVGRGVADYEESKLADDPVRRGNMLAGALSDFDAALKQQPDSAEARYDRIWALYEAGRHQEALAEIDRYLARDSDSIWAAKLKDLQIQIRLENLQAVFNEVERAAHTRNAATLDSIARLVPNQAPTAIRDALRKSLQREGSALKPGEASTAELQWAAETLEKSYGAASGDHSWQALLRFYAGLSPPQRKLKKSLDLELMRLADLLNHEQPAAALAGSESLGREFSHLHDTWQLFNIHSLRGNCFYYQANFERAADEYREMLRVGKLTAAPELRAKALAAQVAIYVPVKRPDDLEACLMDLGQLADQYGRDLWRQWANAGLGSLYRWRHQLNESMKCWTTALASAYRNRDDLSLGSLLQSLYSLMTEMGRFDDAASLYSEAVDNTASYKPGLEQAGQTAFNAIQSTFILRVGEAALESGRVHDAESSFRSGLNGTIGDKHELEDKLRLGLAEALLREEHFSDAAVQIERGLALADSGKYQDLEWRAHVLQGLLHERTGDAAGAIASFQESIFVFERMPARIRTGTLLQQYPALRLNPYQEIVSLLSRSLHDEKRASDYADCEKSMLDEYQDIATQEKAGGTAPETVNSPGVLSIDYFFTGDDLLAFVSDRDRLQTVALHASRNEIEQRVNQYLKSIEAGDEPGFDSLSGRLYSELVGPVLQAVRDKKIDQLVIFPDGPLNRLPFAGLKNDRGRYLLEDFVLSFAPSRSVLARCLSLDRGTAATGGRTALLLDGTASLPGAGDELARLSTLYGKGSRIVTARNLAAASGLAADAGILHFAGHAALQNGAPVLMLDAGPHPVFLDSNEIRSWRLRRNGLVTLAGCETGVGPRTEGFTPWGLVPAFLDAGAPALIVSLLPVDDVATSKVTSRFYELLSAGGISKASALRQAQLSLLAAARASGRSNPGSWLPYVLVGDPR
jgi:CHAT domain-containing protein/thioredoxin-like negative regulator of GroEL